MMNGKTVIRDGRELHVRREQGLSSTELSPRNTFHRSIPDILTVSCRRRFLHMNHHALELMGYLNQTEIGSVNDISMTAVHELRILVQENLDDRKRDSIWELFE